jgi:cation:H+ antiporter
LAALFRPLPMGHRVRQYALLSAVAGGLAVLALVGGHVSRVEGGLLLAAYVGLVALVWWREKEPPALGELAEIDDDEESDRRPGVALGLAVVGIALMLVGGDLAVRGAVRVVDAIGRSDSAVGLTILALATTAELFALVLTAARHDVPEIAVAGIVGSAAYNATATLGAAALARPLAVEGVIWAAVAAALLPLVILLFARHGHLGRVAGGALCAGYAAYAVVVLR